MKQLPPFRLNPNAADLGIFTAHDGVCSVCIEKTTMVYDGPVASTLAVADICPWCIADGRAAETYDAEFAGASGTEEVDDAEALDELLYHTPGFNTFQEIIWPAHCGLPSAYIGPVGKKEVKPMRHELIDDIELIADAYGIDEEALIDDLTTEGSMQGHLFKCLACDQHRLVVDQE